MISWLLIWHIFKVGLKSSLLGFRPTFQMDSNICVSICLLLGSYFTYWFYLKAIVYNHTTKCRLTPIDIGVIHIGVGLNFLLLTCDLTEIWVKELFRFHRKMPESQYKITIDWDALRCTELVYLASPYNKRCMCELWVHFLDLLL